MNWLLDEEANDKELLKWYKGEPDKKDESR